MSLSNLNNKTFTIINRIPISCDNAQIAEYHKCKLKGCDVRNSFADKTSGTIVSKANTWTAYVSDWEHYKAPVWHKGGFYALGNKSGFYTAQNGDLLIFADITDEVPKSSREFQALIGKYKDLGGIITQASAYISYRDEEKQIPWRTNHIEIIKG